MEDFEIVMNENEAQDAYANDDYDVSETIITDNVKVYLNQISRIPLLSFEEEILQGANTSFFSSRIFSASASVIAATFSVISFSSRFTTLAPSFSLMENSS